MISANGVLATGRKTINNWWNVASATCLCAWQGKGAASAAAAKLDLTNNGRHLIGGDPTWTIAEGWSGGVWLYPTYQNIGLGQSISVVWWGQVRKGNYDYFWRNWGGNWYGLTAHSHPSLGVAIGYNTSILIGASSPEAIPDCTSLHITYTKGSTTGPQKLYINGALDNTRNDGNAPYYTDVYMITGYKCHAAAVYNGAISAEDIAKIVNDLNKI